jgi:pimeloyl-ACP methyl ester carboxylesterase
VITERQTIDVDGMAIRYLTAGDGPPLLLLHALGESALDWRWVMPVLSRTHRVYAPDLPGFGDSDKPAADYTPAFFGHFVAAFLDTLDVERATVVGNSLGGLAALRLALSDPSRVVALGLMASAGLGREVSFALRSLTLPGYGEAAMAWSATPLGSLQRAWGRVALLFANPKRVPAVWVEEQRRLARTPGFLKAALTALRAQVDLGGQREVLLDRLPRLSMPTLVVWGTADKVFPVRQARDAVSQLDKGRLEIMQGCGHLPHVEQPERLATILSHFLAHPHHAG